MTKESWYKDQGFILKATRGVLYTHVTIRYHNTELIQYYCDTLRQPIVKG